MLLNIFQIITEEDSRNTSLCQILNLIFSQFTTKLSTTKKLAITLLHTWLRSLRTSWHFCVTRLISLKICVSSSFCALLESSFPVFSSPFSGTSVTGPQLSHKRWSDLKISESSNNFSGFFIYWLKWPFYLDFLKSFNRSSDSGILTSWDTQAV